MTPSQDSTAFTKRFLEFARSKPADTAYDPGSYSRCALAQFGYRVTRWTSEDKGIPLPTYHAATTTGPYTFGALVDRLEKLL